MTTLATAATRRLLTTARPSATRTSVSGSVTPRRTYSSQPPRGPNATVKFWPFILVIIIGTGAFAYVSKSRAGQGRAPIARNEIPNR
ncbi:hypothetical protein F4680DRAFT_244282 [Xylaria scruposa]|nr:hypothetical protein F4680DRAFT_244282 [Xylaria scruposa]